MRKVIAIVLIATILITAIVGSVAARLLTSEQQEPPSEMTGTRPTSSSLSGSESGWPESVEPAYLNPVLFPGLDLDYDDRWVANIPEFIDGYKVLTVETPKSAACSDWPLITFHATQKSLDEYLAAAPDMNSLRESVLAIPGVPSDIGMSFAGAPLDESGEPPDREEYALMEKSRNEDIARIGCQDHRIILPRIVEGLDTSAVPDDESGISEIEDP